MAHQRLPRRDFLRVTVVSALGAGALPLAGCSKDDPGGTGDEPTDGGGTAPSEKPADQKRVFPQGVASGDPKSDSVLLWTRVEPEEGKESADVKVHYDVATDEAFEHVVASDDVTAAADADHTLRLKVTELDPYTTYYYRFTARKVRSVKGRTKTAPASDQDVSVRFAFAACQDFVGRYYHAWKSIKDEDLDFVVYLGDYVYETDGDPSFMTPGAPSRSIVLPDGQQLGGTTHAALTLADYRALYKQYRSDEHLQEMHRLFPFVSIWDDHEFANDCWGDHATHFNDKEGNEENAEQREAADQAWFEYQPMDVEYDESASFPDDIKIYRKLRFGKHMELFLTDLRYYRDDHVIPEGPADLTVGKFLENSEIGSRIFVLKSGFDPKEAEKKPTMLGAAQKSWLTDGVKASSATWKIWGSEVQLAQMLADLSNFDSVSEIVRNKFYLTVDQWDGYRTERAEVLGALSSVENLVVIAGDIHAFYAANLYTDFDNPSATPVAPEYTVAGITSFAIAPAAENVLASDDTLKGLGLLELIPHFDELLKQGSPHYAYANSSANGVALCELSADEVKMTYVIVPDVTNPDFDGTVERVRFRTAAGSRRVEAL